MGRWAVWLVEFGEYLGAEKTATKPDKIIVNPEWLRCQEAAPRDCFGRRKSSGQRPHEIPLWDSPEKARAEIEAFEPEKYVPGAERARKYRPGG